MATTSQSRRWIWILALTNIVSLIALVLVAKRPVDQPSPDTCASCYNEDYCGQEFARMPVSFAKGLVANYRDNHWRAINGHCESILGNKRVSDSRSAWFSLERLKHFIHAIEERTCVSCGSSRQLGVRIYYGAYASSGDSTQTDPEYNGLHTLLMIPTFHIGQHNIDFDPYVLEADCAPKLFDTTVMVLTPDITARNHGELIPPPYNCTDYLGAEFMRYADTMDYGQICPPALRD